jgi:hypothetical protein
VPEDDPWAQAFTVRPLLGYAVVSDPAAEHVAADTGGQEPGDQRDDRKHLVVRTLGYGDRDRTVHEHLPAAPVTVPRR